MKNCGSTWAKLQQKIFLRILKDLDVCLNIVKARQNPPMGSAVLIWEIVLKGREH